MNQIARAIRAANGNYIIEVKPIQPRVSESEETVQIAGNPGWAEKVPGLFYEDENGEQHPCTVSAQVRYKNKKKKV